MAKEKKRQARVSWSFEGKSESWSNTNLHLKGVRVLYNNHPVIVLQRKKPDELAKKPPFYLFDLENKSFISSLYPAGEAGSFIFDDKETRKHYLIRFSFNESGKVIGSEIEEIGD